MFKITANNIGSLLGRINRNSHYLSGAFAKINNFFLKWTEQNNSNNNSNKNFFISKYRFVEAQEKEEMEPHVHKDEDEEEAEKIKLTFEDFKDCLENKNEMVRIIEIVRPNFAYIENEKAFAEMGSRKVERI